MKPAKQSAKATPAIVVAAEVARQVRQHAHAHMKTEVCGVLIGAIANGKLEIDACIPGKDAAQAGTHVTFTQDTWEHIYKVKDAEYPNARIVGWYHSHPGFGIFLSDHDTFIHRNFFSAAEQVAWVYDPHSDEEGFFGWDDDRIQRLGMVSFADARGGEECSETHARSEPVMEGDEDIAEERPVTTISTTTTWLKWIITVFSHLIAIGLGFLIAWLLIPPRIFVIPMDPITGRALHAPMEIDPAQIMRATPNDHPGAPADAPPPQATPPPQTAPPPQSSGQPAPTDKGEHAQPR